MNVENKILSDMRKRRDTIYGSTSAFSLPIKISSIYEWRIIGLVMLKMQADFSDYRFRLSDKEDLKYQKPLLDQIRFNKRSFGSPFRSDEVEVMFPIEFILSRDDKGKLQGYDKAKKALRNLARAVEVENKNLKDNIFNKECKENGIIWGLAQVIEKPDIRKYNGVNYIYFRVPESTWETLCHWESGVHIFELSVFFKFQRPASVVFYILLADFRKKGWVVWSTKELKERIAPGEYRDYSSFRTNVIDQAKKELKEHSPFYFESCEYVDIDCTIPARKGRGMAANYIKIDIYYQENKNIEVDERIDLFIEMNKLSAFKLEDLTDEERSFLKESLSFKEIKGKNLETIVKLKYYKNYGHQEAANIWRTNPGNYFLEYLKRLYDTIMLSNKPVKDITAYSIATMKKDLEAYEPSNKTPEQIQEQEDAPKRETKEAFVSSHEQDVVWLCELAGSREWKNAMIREFHLDSDITLCSYVLQFRDYIICHSGHSSKQDLTFHFRSLMNGDKEGRDDGWVYLSGKDRWTYDCRNKYLVKDPIFKAFGLEVETKNGKEYIINPNHGQY